jgi:hypothetical protein
MVEVEFKSKGLPRSRKIHGKKVLKPSEVKEACEQFRRMEEHEYLHRELSQGRTLPEYVPVFSQPGVKTTNKLAEGYSYTGKVETLRYFSVLGRVAFERKSRWCWEFSCALLRLPSMMIENAAKEGKRVVDTTRTDMFERNMALRYD